LALGCSYRFGLVGFDRLPSTERRRADIDDCLWHEADVHCDAEHVCSEG